MKKKKRLIWQLYPSYLLIILISLTAVSWYASNSLRHFYLDRTAEDLETRGKLLEEQIIRHLLPWDSTSIDNICKQVGKRASTRITVIRSNGEVIGDSEENPAKMDNHADRPEVINASAGQVGEAIRYSRTLQQEMMYVAIPLRINSKIHSVVRISLPLTSVDDEVNFIKLRIALGGILIALIASGICLYVSRRISRPIEDMKQCADHFARGDLAYRLHAPGTKEMASLAEALNQMAARLENRIKMVVSQRKEIEAILASMIEGLIAVDNQERILSLNQAALNMFQGKISEFKNRSIQEVIRNRKLDRFVRETLATGKTVEGDIIWQNNGEHVLSARSTPLYGDNDNLIGVLVVLNNVTRLRHLENVRQDFVANVSHEIKTPLTAIIGFVETLRSSAMEDPEETDRFLGIIEKHANRLSAIITDLLQLSKIEQGKNIQQFKLEEGPIKQLIKSAIQVCQPKAETKQVRVDLSCEDKITAKIEPRLLEQAFVNLLDNAVKYSREENKVDVRAEQTASEVMVHFQDFGIGIPSTHLPRLFERFYRVDPARSRKLGGTGLGLAIVKHIIQIHEGHVTVKSTPEKGSIFTVHLPK
jgi:two-component system phosphate regulon sensor histidine kinase PhoR